MPSQKVLSSGPLIRLIPIIFACLDVLAKLTASYYTAHNSIAQWLAKVNGLAFASAVVWFCAYQIEVLVSDPYAHLCSFGCQQCLDLGQDSRREHCLFMLTGLFMHQGLMIQLQTFAAFKPDLYSTVVILMQGIYRGPVGVADQEGEKKA